MVIFIFRFSGKGCFNLIFFGSVIKYLFLTVFDEYFFVSLYVFGFVWWWLFLFRCLCRWVLIVVFSSNGLGLLVVAVELDFGGSGK